MLLTKARPRYVDIAALVPPYRTKLPYALIPIYLSSFTEETHADGYILQGPLVGQRQPSSAITQEYATADATYQAKTAVCKHPDVLLFLPLTTHYRHSRKNTHTTARCEVTASVAGVVSDVAYCQYLTTH